MLDTTDPPSSELNRYLYHKDINDLILLLKGHKAMNFIINKEQYLALKARWSVLTHKTATDHAFYNVLRGFPANRGFSPVTNQKKLSNGTSAWDAYEAAKRNATQQAGELVHYQHDNEERRIRREANYSARIKELSERFGIEFTPELRAAIREALQNE